MTTWVDSLLQHGYVGLAVTSFLHGAGAPIPAELLLLAVATLLKTEAILLIPALILFGAANALGVAVPYYAGSAVAAIAARWMSSLPQQRERAERGLRRYGAFMVFATRIVGFLRYACLLLAGSCGIPYYKVAAATFAGTVVYTLCGLFILQVGWQALQHPLTLIMAILRDIWSYR